VNLAEVRKLIGTERLWLPAGTGKVLIGVRVVGARMSYGRAQLHVQPMSGRGDRWVDAELTQGLED
jgi:hypothetical protein